MQRALYLPGLELRTTASGNTETEGLQVITVGEAGRAHWESGEPEGIGNTVQLRQPHRQQQPGTGYRLQHY